MGKFTGFEHGIGIGGWLTNYKRFQVLPVEKRMDLTIGDLEHFQSYITEKDVQYISTLGVDHIRLGFDQIVVEESPYVYREWIVNTLVNFVLWCKKYGLNVVLNLHKAVGNYCDIDEDKKLLDDEELQERFIALWMKLEEVFADYPDVAFEILNEVTNVDPDKWNNLAEKTLCEIRKQNKTRKIIIGSIEWNHVSRLADLRVYDDENVIYTFHMYEPEEFTHQRGVLRSSTLYYNRNMEYPGDVEKYRDYKKVVWDVEDAYLEYERIDAGFVNQFLQPALDFKKKNPGKILWCGEFGTIRHIPIRYRENYMRDVIRFCKKNDIPYCVWNYLSTPNDGNRFSLVDDDERKILSEEMARIIRGEVD